MVFSTSLIFASTAIALTNTLSVQDIAEDSNGDVVQGYGFVGLTQNLENRIVDTESIPAMYSKETTNETEYKVCFDFMTSDSKADSTSNSAQKLMLWLHWEGGQLRIGYADGSVA
ncbi:hypothetical protein AC579_257 [Pseudocercospora musae]|uniref:Uncharacterized protein n=1 Tax=Pseudocercospora musae TaxID=113226 RepID=A0A139I0L3_9PEZI|nr:hypothetical protein AC579_257 [Pseudocercospora musae]